MTEPPAPVTLEEVQALTTWEDALDVATRGINEIRDLKAQLPTLQQAARTARDALQAVQDRREQLRIIMAALLAKAPELE